MLNQQDYFDRQILAAIAERDDLLERRFIKRKLTEPVQRGWRRIFVLTAHAERRHDRDILAEILEVIGTERRCRHLDFRTLPSRSRKLIEIEQSLRRLWDWQLEKLPRSSAWRPYFHWRHYNEWGRPRYFGEFINPKLFELRVEPFWIWEIDELDPAIETRLEELHRWLELRLGWKRYGWLKGIQQRYRWKDEDSAQQRSLEHEQKSEIARAY